MKQELGGKMMDEFIRIKRKTYSYLMHDLGDLLAKSMIYSLKKLTRIALSANTDKRIQSIDSIET